MKHPLQHLDILIDEDLGELRKIAMSSDHFRLQWRALPPGGLVAMQSLLADPDGEFKEILIGCIFNASVYLCRREGIFGFKVELPTGNDLVRITLTEDLVALFQEWLADTIQDWGP
jgi:hypothetical protein